MSYVLIVSKLKMAVDYWKKLNQKPAICKAKNMTYTRSTKVLY